MKYLINLLVITDSKLRMKGRQLHNPLPPPDPIPFFYLRVDNVSLWLTPAGEMVAIMIVLELPPRLSFSNHVNTESLNRFQKIKILPGTAGSGGVWFVA